MPRDIVLIWTVKFGQPPMICQVAVEFYNCETFLPQTICGYLQCMLAPKTL